MFKKIFLTIFLLSTSNSLANQGSLTLKWNNSEGLKKLESSQYKNDFYQIATHFQPQINPLYCGVASSVIILNAINEDKEIVSQKDLEVIKPKVLGVGKVPFNSYSQLTFLNEKTDKIKDRKIINLKNITAENESDARNFDAGFKLKQLAEVLKIYQLQTQISYVEKADQKSLEKFRKLLTEILSEDKKFLLVNFDGKSLGLKTNGHISPAVAFDQASDSVLIMDVAGHKNGWYWVKVEDLIKAMNTKDDDSYRGYLVVNSLE